MDVEEPVKREKVARNKVKSDKPIAVHYIHQSFTPHFNHNFLVSLSFRCR